MASITEYRNKEGKLTSFFIRVHKGRGADGKQLKPYTATFKVTGNWSDKTARKKAEDFAAVFEKECKEGIRSDTRQTFESYCNYVIQLKEQRGLKHSTIVRYKELADRIHPCIGHIKLKDLRPDMLNEFYGLLSQDGINKRTGGGLDPKTILEHHRLISTVLDQATKEGVVTNNVASRATPPKVTQKVPNYFQPETVIEIAKALEQIPIKWKVLIHLYLITGARRGEILGLKWPKVYFESNKIYIGNAILYSPDIGIYEEEPKTEKSKRFTSLPSETMKLLKEYQEWQTENIRQLGSYYHNQNYLFTKHDGSPMHPDSITDYCAKFSKQFNLPHINPHAFRHTMASLLYYNGQDTISISARLGHANPTTTAKIYAHVIEEADQKNAEILSDIFLRKE